MPEETIFTQILKLVPLAALIITVTGWVVSSRFSSRNTGIHAKNTEINKLIDALNKALDDIFNEMATVLSSTYDDTQKTISYYKFIMMIKNVHFICDAIQKLDAEQKTDYMKILTLRQTCTNDRKYDPKKINTTLPQLQDIQEQIKRSYSKKFTFK